LSPPLSAFCFDSEKHDLVAGKVLGSPKATAAEDGLKLQQGEGTMTMRRPWVGMASFVAVLLVVALGHRLSVTASWFTSDKTCAERHATPWFVERLDIDCDRLLRERLWKLYDEGHLFGRLRGGRGGAVEYMKELYMKQLQHPDED
jgi:hypothetical protein